MDKTLKIGTHSFQSRLMVGTGKYKDFEETKSAITASGAEVVTVALRRTNMGQNKDEPNLLDFIDPNKWTILPNTAGCFNAEDAVRTCQLTCSDCILSVKTPSSIWKDGPLIWVNKVQQIGFIFVLTHISSSQCDRNYFRTRCSDSTFSFFKIFIFTGSNHQTRLKRMRAYF